MTHTRWPAPDPELVRYIDEWQSVVPRVYREDSKLLEEHVRQESSFRTSGYSRRQVTELVQNAADAIYKSGTRGKIELVLTEDHLYCANDGKAFERAGVEAITHAYLSDKRGGEIGRYGLGFKSVLAVSENPQIFSRSASFQFGSPAAREVLKTLDTVEGDTPVLRLATPLDYTVAAEHDNVLRQLGAWATTIVRLPLSRDAGLVEQLREFQTQFLIFTPHVEALTISIHRGGGEETLEHTCRALGSSSYELKGPQLGKQQWSIFTTEHQPSLAAREEVDDAIARKSILLTCAMPMGGRLREGEFWANFPLSDHTSAAGIFNAPWALSEDRSHILTTKQYNLEIFESMAQLFVDSLPAMRTPEQPARHLAYLPSRPQESHSPADKALISEIHRRAAHAALIPDSTGTLRHGHELVALNHGVTLPSVAMATWSAAPHTRTNVPHESCYADDKSRVFRIRLRELHRRAFADANALLQRDLPASENEIDLWKWLSELGDVDDVLYSRQALEMIPLVEPEKARHGAVRASIVPTDGGRRATLGDHSRVHLPPEGGVHIPGHELVLEALADNTNCRRVLRSFGYTPLDDEVVLRSMLRRMGGASPDDQWDALWNQALNLEPRKLVLLFEEWRKLGHVVKVLTAANTWRDSTEVFNLRTPPIRLPWDDRVLAPNFLPTQSLLEVLGILTELSPTYPVIEAEEPEFVEYRLWAVEQAHGAEALDQESGPEEWYFAEERAGGPIGLIHELALTDPPMEDEVVQLTSAMLRINAVRTWNLRSPDGSENFEVPAPHLWAAMEWGKAETTFGVLPTLLAVSPSLKHYYPWVPLPKDSYLGILPLAESIDEMRPEDLVEGMRRGRGLTATPAVLDSLLKFLATALPQLRGNQPWAGEVPAVTDNTIDLFPAGQVFIASDQAQVNVLRRSKNPYLPVEDDDLRERILEHADFLDAQTAIRFEILPIEPRGPISLVDCIRPVKRLLDRKDRSLNITQCTTIITRQITPDGVQEQTIPRAFNDGMVYVTSDPTIPDDAHNLLAWVNQEVGLGLSAADIDSAVEAMFDVTTEELKQRCRAAPSPAARLEQLATADQLRAKLPSGLLDTLRAMGTPVQDREVPELFLDSFGTDSLSQLTDEMRALRLDPPDRWGGSSPARRFVTDLGFTPDFAGTQRPSRPPSETVMGKPGLGELHDYQKEALRDLRFLLRSNPGNADKALLELPTGAGKTRVAVESLVRTFLAKDFQVAGPVLWIAQSEELCEQAITTWSEVWREFSDERPLSIHRFFGPHQPNAPELELSVVVATDAMLDVHNHDDTYDWVYSPVAVVVDEAHRAADSKRYRSLFDRLGVGLTRHERPLIGLSATPYRGRNPEATTLLAKRFGNNLVQTLGENPIQELQERGVLARIDHQVLPGVKLSVPENEIRTKNLSQGTLNLVGEDQGRTRGIVEHIMDLPEDWKVLVFMPSVLSAQVLATILKSKGAAAASVSGRSSRGERSAVISRFKEGDLQVLVNCDLLTQGFDAPKVRALYVARPTLSESQYVQMVGRGLRGPKNGGSERCLVVNLEDTIENVDVDLAYRDFTQYWGKEQS